MDLQRVARKRLGSSYIKKKARKDVPMVDLSNCKYEVLRIVLRKNGWDEGGEDDKRCHLIWTGMTHFEHKENLLNTKEYICAIGSSIINIKKTQSSLYVINIECLIKLCD